VGSAIIKLHPKLPIGKTVDEIAASGNSLVYGTYQAIFDAVNLYNGTSSF
jgi:hypothetical protein